MEMEQQISSGLVQKKEESSEVAEEGREIRATAFLRSSAYRTNRPQILESSKTTLLYSNR